MLKNTLLTFIFFFDDIIYVQSKMINISKV